MNNTKGSGFAETSNRAGGCSAPTMVRVVAAAALSEVLAAPTHSASHLPGAETDGRETKFSAGVILSAHLPLNFAK
ncbi:MAG: hypothetical protein IK105_00700 [Thermoguttaceae bacterium]|nr:hypothetical protein [Thermoguttaceae bacterium]